MKQYVGYTAKGTRTVTMLRAILAATAMLAWLGCQPASAQHIAEPFSIGDWTLATEIQFQGSRQFYHMTTVVDPDKDLSTGLSPMLIISCSTPNDYSTRIVLDHDYPSIANQKVPIALGANINTTDVILSATADPSGEALDAPLTEQQMRQLSSSTLVIAVRFNPLPRVKAPIFPAKAAQYAFTALYAACNYRPK